MKYIRWDGERGKWTISDEGGVFGTSARAEVLRGKYPDASVESLSDAQVQMMKEVRGV